MVNFLRSHYGGTKSPSINVIQCLCYPCQAMPGRKKPPRLINRYAGTSRKPSVKMLWQLPFLSPLDFRTPRHQATQGVGCFFAPNQSLSWDELLPGMEWRMPPEDFALHAYTPWQVTEASQRLNWQARNRKYARRNPPFHHFNPCHFYLVPQN